MRIPAKWCLGIAVLLLAVAFIFLAKPVYQSAKVLRARWLVQDLYYDEFDTSGFYRIRTALELAPNDLTVLRKACEIYGELNFTIGYIHWLKLLRHEEVTVSDYGVFLDFLIKAGQPTIFRPYAARLATNVRPDEIKLVLARYHLVMNNTSLSGLLLEELYRSDAKTAEVCYLLGLTLLQQGWPSEREEAAQLLQESIRMDPRFRAESVGLLIKHRLLKEEEMLQLVGYLIDSEDGIRQRLLAYRLEASANNESQDVVLEKVEREFRGSDDGTKLEVGRWMNRNRFYQQTTEFISETLASGNRDLFLVRVDAMAAANRWQELEELFRGDVPLTREIQELFRFRIAHELGKPDVADVLWNRALDLARDKPVLLWYYSGYVERLGLQQREESAYRSLLPITAHKRGAYLALVELLDKTGQTRKLFELLGTMRKEYPNDPEVANDWAYCALLLEHEIESLEAQVRSAVEQSPEVLAYRITYGLYLLRIGQNKAALRLFEGLPLPPYMDWLLEWRAVYLAILLQNELRPQAAEVMATIAINQLKKEEAALIQFY
ncbi:MAG: hypothetical protein AAF649_05650 [Verrucomicrobiota bacterium]